MKPRFRLHYTTFTGKASEKERVLVRVAQSSGHKAEVDRSHGVLPASVKCMALNRVLACSTAAGYYPFMSDPRQFSTLLEQLSLVRRYGLDIHAVEEDGERLLEVEDTSELEFLEGRDFTWLMRQEDLLETLAELKKRKDELWEFLRGYSGGAQ